LNIWYLTADIIFQEQVDFKKLIDTPNGGIMKKV
jgi:hypothetical protein